jgi:hypothetical protein
LAGAMLKEELDAGIDYAKYEETMLQLRSNGGLEVPGESFDDREEFLQVNSVEQGDGQSVRVERVLTLLKPFEVTESIESVSSTVAIAPFPSRRKKEQLGAVETLQTLIA